MKIGLDLKKQLEKQILNKAFQHRCGFASTGQFVSCAFVVLLRKSIPQRTTYKLPLNLALANIMNKEISTAIVHSYHKRAHVPLMQAKEILNKMDNELFNRVLRAMNEQPDAKEPFFDPIESDPEMQEIIAQAKKEAEDIVKRRNGLRRGSCHLIWREAAIILKEKHNISWYSPAKMNPLVCYD